jgi:hypothetical protein
MLKSALAGAVALATIGCSFAHANDWQDDSAPKAHHASQSGAADSQIAQFKAALRLKPEQERHWPRVAAAIREFVSRQSGGQDQASGGMIQRISARAGSYVSSANAIRRLVAAATPLVRTLDQEQKQTAISLASSMGFGDVAAHFN